MFIRDPVHAATKEERYTTSMPQIKPSVSSTVGLSGEDEHWPECWQSEQYRKDVLQQQQEHAKKKAKRQAAGLPHDWLLQCRECGVTVHAGCYNVSAECMKRKLFFSRTTI